VVAGKDAQLSAAIDEILKRIAEQPMEIPQPPAYPIKTKAAENAAAR
jgi:hypothetical protein